MSTQENSINFTFQPEALDSKYYLKGTRVPVWLLVSMLDNGITEEQILIKYPSLSPAEIKAATNYAGVAV
jgi:uncharacterized protein (DUF433 family)